MDNRWYCHRCDAPKTRQDLREVDFHETCTYACRQCGEVEGIWFQAGGSKEDATPGLPFADLDTALRARGWTPGRPQRRGLIDGPALDAATATDSVCEACGHRTLDFYAYVDSQQHYAAAVARCPQCDAAFDF